MDGETLLRSEFMRPTSRITVFAPINAAWNNLEANGIATADIQSNNTLLNLILKQHVLESVPQANGLASVSGELNTRLPASPLNTTSGLSPNNGGQVSVLNSVGKIQSAQILEVAELCLQRGIVFLIDQVCQLKMLYLKILFSLILCQLLRKKVYKTVKIPYFLIHCQVKSNKFCKTARIQFFSTQD
eukprot:TRINITY_DN28526_c0_g1_i6.p3 TRINITY_DN28526_c0_g1~~TRINITY_DN28526_c0_g1_i6.p3  ORF type:complete len:187 (+),score=5.72 TRINITY_DN28526_c0_g1_i6:232-792(+)